MKLLPRHAESSDNNFMIEVCPEQRGWLGSALRRRRIGDADPHSGWHSIPRPGDGQLAVEQGHEVTCAARGVSGVVPAGARFVAADRDDPESLVPLADAGFDAVVDVTRQISHARHALAALADHVGHWSLVSTISVYADHTTPGQTAADAPVLAPAPPDVDGPVGPDHRWYGECKVSIEQAGPGAGRRGPFVHLPGGADRRCGGSERPFPVLGAAAVGRWRGAGTRTPDRPGAVRGRRRSGALVVARCRRRPRAARTTAPVRRCLGPICWPGWPPGWASPTRSSPGSIRSSCCRTTYASGRGAGAAALGATAGDRRPDGPGCPTGPGSRVDGPSAGRHRSGDRVLDGRAPPAVRQGGLDPADEAAILGKWQAVRDR